jgi:methylated-DNA-[protein]-cysteine S-methyltransferase
LRALVRACRTQRRESSSEKKKLSSPAPHWRKIPLRQTSNGGQLEGTDMVYDHLDSPVGKLLLAAEDGGLRYIGFELGRHPVWIGDDWRRDAAAFSAAREQLTAYFAGELTEFDLPLAPHGTPFQLGVWSQLRNIPYGATISYGELAERVGDRSASRAVGAANGRNPLPIVVPCHRVIGADGSLTGFGGGIATKKFLLEHEQKYAAFTLT